jgi:transcriptional regulator with XRE-family HTH domain
MPDYPSQLDKGARSNESGDNLGQRIRAMRKAARLTLESVSAASGVSRAALSKIERGEMSPTYETLLKVARGLGTDLTDLLSGRRPAGGGYDVTRAGEGAEYRAGRFAHRLLAPALPNRAFYAFVTEVRGTRLQNYGHWHSHDSEDFLYVLDGVVAVHLSDRPTIELRRGDSMQMDGRIAHALVARPSGDKPAKKPVARLLWITVPFA